MNQEFPGKLSTIAPKLILDPDKNDLNETFFLTLALIFNDLKTLLVFGDAIVKIYRKPTPEETSVQTGEMNGIYRYLDRLVSGLVNEFLRFLLENKSVLDSIEFRLLFKQLPAEAARCWADLEDVAFSRKSGKQSEFRRAIEVIRHNVTFHYYQTGTVLRKSFINRFFTKEQGKNLRNEFAYYAHGKILPETRFYYADAAVEEYLFKSALESGDNADLDMESFIQYRNKINTVVREMNLSVGIILKNYIDRKKRS